MKGQWDNDKPVEDVWLDIVEGLPTLEFFRIRARHVNVKHKRYWEVLQNGKPSPFVQKPPERHVMTVLDRNIALHRFICFHINDIWFIPNNIERNASAKARLNRKNASGGRRHKN